MCTRPLHYFESNLIDNETGKKPGFITGYQVKLAGFRLFAKHGIACTETYLAKPVEVPCGKCPECRKALKMQWVARAVAELETSKHAYFLTLTYDNDHLPSDFMCHKEHIQVFLNRFRKNNKTRYLIVGEHGELSNRPHYHAILYTENPIDDLIPVNKSKTLPLYESDKVTKQWQNGIVKIGVAYPQAIAYSVGYLVSKEKKTAFKMQSQGLGYQFFSGLNRRYVLSDMHGHEMIVSLPRYLKKKYDLNFDYDDSLNSIKWHNEVVASGLKEETYRDFKEYLEESKLQK